MTQHDRLALRVRTERDEHLGLPVDPLDADRELASNELLPRRTERRAQFVLRHAESERSDAAAGMDLESDVVGHRGSAGSEFVREHDLDGKRVSGAIEEFDV